MGIDNREDLIQTIFHRMMDDATTRQIWPLFISAGLRYLRVTGANLPRSLAKVGQIMRDLLPKPHYVGGRAALKALDYARMGLFMCRMGC